MQAYRTNDLNMAAYLTAAGCKTDPEPMPMNSFLYRFTVRANEQVLRNAIEDWQRRHPLLVPIHQFLKVRQELKQEIKKLRAGIKEEAMAGAGK